MTLWGEPMSAKPKHIKLFVQHRASDQANRDNWGNWTRDQLDRREDWIPRAKLAASFAQPGDRVLDIGCGAQFPKRYLPAGCTYVPSDLAARSEDTIVADLSRNEFPDGRYDLGLLLGVLEFTPNAEFIFERFAMAVDRLVFSYCFATMGGKKNASFRHNSKFLTDFSTAQLQDMVVGAGFRIVHMQVITRAEMLTQILAVAENCHPPPPDLGGEDDAPAGRTA